MSKSFGFRIPAEESSFDVMLGGFGFSQALLLEGTRVPFGGKEYLMARFRILFWEFELVFHVQGCRVECLVSGLLSQFRSEDSEACGKRLG